MGKGAGNVLLGTLRCPIPGWWMGSRLEGPILQFPQHFLDLALNSQEFGFSPGIGSLAAAALQVLQEEGEVLPNPLAVPEGQVPLHHVQDVGPVIGDVGACREENQSPDAVPVHAQAVKSPLAILTDVIEVEAGEAAGDTGEG